MAAGGFREFVAGEVLDEDEINDYLMQGVLVFAGTAARGSAITAPVEGQFSFLKDSDTVEFYDGSQWVEFSTTGPVEVDFLVIGGGASGGVGGGGAGGYRTSTGTSGGSAAAEPILNLETGIDYLVVVGSGGGISGEAGGRGHASVFGPISSIGGGFGGLNVAGDYGGSGGGGHPALAGGATVPGQGRAGGTGAANAGGGGGGAGTIGSNAPTGPVGGAGGAGLANSITGTSVTRAGGGGGGGVDAGGAGGAGGGTSGTANANVVTPAANLGAGSGGIFQSLSQIRPGGSGVVIVKFPDTWTITVGAGLTSSTTTSGGFKIVSFTAGYDFVSFS